MFEELFGSGTDEADKNQGNLKNKVCKGCYVLQYLCVLAKIFVWGAPGPLLHVPFTKEPGGTFSVRGSKKSVYDNDTPGLTKKHEFKHILWAR